MKNERIYNLIGSLICIFKGHFSEKYLNETDERICTTRCKRCHKTLMDGFTLKIKHIPPPNSNKIQIKQWEKHCEEMEADSRRDLKIERHKI